MDGMIEEERRKNLKEVLKLLHEGAPPEEVKERFGHILQGVSPLELARAEEELVREGIPREEIQRLCDIHLTILKEQLEKQGLAEQASPIKILMEEHKMIKQIAQRLITLTERVKKADSPEAATEELTELKQILEDLLDAEKHYLREENALFPILERHGISEPPAIMRIEHNQHREKKKQLKTLLIEDAAKIDFQDFKRQLDELAIAICSDLNSHIYKEDNILFPAAQQVVTMQEWIRMREDFDEIGYCCFTPEHLIEKQAKGLEQHKMEEAQS
jgi:DUF438 domain-containing protein